MSSREIVINTLCGILLLLVFAAPLGVVIVAAGYALGFLSKTLISFGFPTDAIVYVLIGGVVLVSGLQQVVKKMWLNALFSFAMLPLAVWALLGDRGDAHITALFLFLLAISVSPRRERLRAWEFVSGIFLAVGVILSRTYGSNSSHMLADCVLIIAFAWLLFQSRRGQIEPANVRSLPPASS